LLDVAEVCNDLQVKLKVIDEASKTTHPG